MIRSGRSPEPIPPSFRIPAEAPMAYRLQPKDAISVKFYYQPQLNEDLIIRPDGKISLQLVNDVEAANKTVAELAASITQKYRNILSRPEAAVILRSIAQHRLYVGGEIRQPGMILWEEPVTALQAIFQAGGFAPTADNRRTVLIRRDPQGRANFYLCDLELSENDFFLQPYDILFVPRSSVASADLFVEQYIDKLIPISRAFGFSLYYDLNNSFYPVAP